MECPDSAWPFNGSDEVLVSRGRLLDGPSRQREARGMTAPSSEDAPLPTERYAGGAEDGIARDAVLGRSVAVRRADAAGAEALAQEARFLAGLEHAGLPTVHDFVRTQDGALLVQRRVDGVPLGEAIAAAREGAPCPELADAPAVLQLLQRACEAVAAAHARGVVHRALSPAVIILGRHGEVLVGGWTPPAPSIATDDLHVDVRALGACLFTALVRRPPTPGAADPFADVGAAEGALLSPPLCALIRRALRSDRVGGFRDVAELGAALARCAAAELAAAGPGPGRFRPPRRWPRRLAAALAVLALLAVALALPHWRHPGDAWRQEIARETFADDGWRERWSGGDDWTLKDGRLVSTAEFSGRLTLRRRLAVPVAIEYTGQILPGQRPGDLSVVWSESGAEGGGKGAKEVAGARTFSIQAGAFDNSYCGIFLQPGDRRLAYSAKRLVPGHDHRFRVEIESGRIAMLIDGELVLEHRDRFPSTSGYIALLSWYPGKAFDDVVVLGQPVLDRVPATAMGDALYGFGQYDAAAALYGRLAEGGEVEDRRVQDALFRKGMAERRAGRPGDAAETWALLSDPELAQAADTVRLEDLLRTGQLELFSERLRAYWRRSLQGRHELRLQWSAAAAAVIAASGQADAGFAEALLAVRRELFPKDDLTGYEAARLLVRLGRYEEVLRDFPDERRRRIEALIHLGRLEELDRLDYLVPMDRMYINLSRGNLTAVAVEMRADTYHGAFALCKLGRGAELKDRLLIHPGMLHSGQAERMLAERPLSGGMANEALIVLGRYQDALTGLPDIPDSGRSWQAAALLGRLDEAEALNRGPLPWMRLLKALEAGDVQAAATARAELKPPGSLWPNASGAWFPGMVLGPFADLLAGRPEAFDAAMALMAKDWRQYFCQTPWRFARAVRGEVGESEVLGMPAVTEGAAWWHLACALRAERAGDAAAARQAYAAFVALPRHQRLLDGNMMSCPVEGLVAWRQRALAK